MEAPTLHHIAIIMDGNGRWASARGLPRCIGHRRGAEAVRRTVRHCRESGLSYLTLYAFSLENWARPVLEVEALMELLARFLADHTAELVEHGVELCSIGDTRRLPARARVLLGDAVRATRGGAMRLTLALSYSGQDEIARAARRLARRAASGELDPACIDIAHFTAELDTGDTPPVDLVIRTGSEHRLSNFLLWQSAYAELYFTDQAWPDFGPEDLDDAVAWYHERRRTFGLVEAAG